MWITHTDHIDCDLTALHISRALSDSQKRTQICKKFGSSFAQLKHQMTGGPHETEWSYDEIVTQIRKMENIERIQNSSAITNTSFDTQHVPGASSSLINSNMATKKRSFGKSYACKNCQGDHSVKDCRETCTLCASHVPMNCPEFLEKKRRYQQQRSNSSTSKKQKTSENIYKSVISNPKFKVQHVQVVDNDEEQWFEHDEFLPNSSDFGNDDYNDEDVPDEHYQNYMISSQVSAQIVDVEKLSIGLIDTGANMPMSNPVLAKMLGLPLQLWPEPVHIEFGNSSSGSSTHYIYLGELIGNVALLDSAHATLLTRHCLHQHGISLAFDADGSCRLYMQKSGETLYSLTMNSTNDFFKIPLEALLPYELGLKLDAYKLEHATREVNSRRALPPVTQEEITKVMMLHERMYHPSVAVMARAIRHGAWSQVDISPTLVERVFKSRDCVFCSLGKMKRLSCGQGSAVKPPMGQEISVDFVPVNPVAKGGYTGVYIMVERTTGYAWVYLIRKNSGIFLIKAVRHVKTCLDKFSFILRNVRTDAGKVENAHQVAVTLASFGIELNAAASEAQFQNYVESFIQTAIRGVATVMIAQSFLDNTFWGMALLAWIRAWNCRPNENSGLYSPSFHLTGKHPSLDQFKFPFGTTVVSRTLRRKTSGDHFKFNPSGEFGVVVGNAESRNGASLVYFPGKKLTVAFPRLDLQRVQLGNNMLPPQLLEKHMEGLNISQEGEIHMPSIPLSSQPVQQAIDITDDHSLSPSEGDDEKGIKFDDMFTEERDNPSDAKTVDLDTVYENQEVGKSVDNHGPDESLNVVEDMPALVDTVDDEGDVLDGSNDSISKSTGVESVSLPDNVIDGPAGGTRSRTKHQSIVLDNNSAVVVYSLAKSASVEDNPTFRQAMCTPEADHWRAAIVKELKSLVEHNTGTEVIKEDIPAGNQIIPTKLVLKIKRDTLGMPIKYKARLVVLGNLKRKSSISEVFAPTVNDKSLKILLSLATTKNLILKSIDVYGAFLYPTETNDVYVALPPTITGGDSVTWKLNKTMYGLPESPAAFYSHVSQHLLSQGYQRAINDPCFFWQHYDSGFILLVVHVDDFAVASTHHSIIDTFIKDLEKEYVVSVSDEVKHFLGLHVQQLPNHEGIVLSQPGLLKKLFERYDHITKLTRFPTVPMASTYSDDQQDDAPPCSKDKYMELLGSLLYAIKTRPDIAYAVTKQAMRAKDPTTKDMNSLFQILAYLYATQDLGTVLRGCSSDSYEVMAWCDASCGVHVNGRAHTGYGFSGGDNPNSGLFFARTVKQKVATLSSTEAELMAMVETTKDILWIRNLLEEIGFPPPGPTILKVDYCGAVTLANQYSGNHKRIKHFIMKVHFMIEQVNLGKVKLVKVDTKENIADPLTKPLGPTDFLKKRKGMLGM